MEHESLEGAVVVRVTGAVDSSTVDEVTAHLTAALKLAETHPARLVVVDLQAVDFFGSAALNAVLDCHDEGKEAGTAVRLVANNDQVLRPIEVTELNRIFDIYPTLPEALQHKRQQ